MLSGCWEIIAVDNHNEEFYKISSGHLGVASTSNREGQAKLPKGNVILPET